MAQKISERRSLYKKRSLIYRKLCSLMWRTTNKKSLIANKRNLRHSTGANSVEASGTSRKTAERVSGITLCALANALTHSASPHSQLAEGHLPYSGRGVQRQCSSRTSERHSTSVLRERDWKKDGKTTKYGTSKNSVVKGQKFVFRSEPVLIIYCS